ncbi:hypothetical protein LCGC14_1848350 [marine sediment metagenome]|uniref:Uncharacterized protein n=1 Tax=marine sediment metagenome TaxID=412755 RepID=A0A0F9GB12_9ZZZZ
MSTKHEPLVVILTREELIFIEADLRSNVVKKHACKDCRKRTVLADKIKKILGEGNMTKIEKCGGCKKKLIPEEEKSISRVLAKGNFYSLCYECLAKRG